LKQKPKMEKKIINAKNLKTQICKKIIENVRNKKLKEKKMIVGYGMKVLLRPFLLFYKLASRNLD